MSPCALLETRHASTQAIDRDLRLAFWEDYNASTLVGLKCNSYAESGFAARQDNLHLSAMRLARIVGNEHVVERDRSMIRGAPKESIFVSWSPTAVRSSTRVAPASCCSRASWWCIAPTSPTCSVFPPPCASSSSIFPRSSSPAVACGASTSR